MTEDKIEALHSIEKYYTKKVIDHGATPQGVDWNGSASQYLRFEQLAKIFHSRENLTVNDLGCGYGAFFEYLKNHKPAATYLGVDMSEAMISEARRVRIQSDDCLFYVGRSCPRVADYTVASGIFNVRLQASDEVWWQYITETLADMHAASHRGYSFNCLTSYSDSDRMRPYLYYADPCKVFDYCKRSFSRNVALLHDYDLYEFTILVRKQGYFET